MEADHLGSGSFLKMTADRIANFCWKFGECIGLRKNRSPKGSSNETTLRCLFNYEEQLCSTQPRRPRFPRSSEWPSLRSPEPLLIPVTCDADEHEQVILRNNDHLDVEASGFLTQRFGNLSFRHEQH